MLILLNNIYLFNFILIIFFSFFACTAKIKPLNPNSSGVTTIVIPKNSTAFSNSTVVASPQAASISGPPAFITATILDSNNNLVPGKRVTFISSSATTTISNVSTPSRGVYTVSISDSVAETVTVAAIDSTDGINLGTATVVFMNPPILSSTVSGAYAYFVQGFSTTHLNNAITFTSTGGPIIRCAVTSGTLPAGLSIDSSNCTISGTPTVFANPTSITVTATNVSGSSSVSFTILVNGLSMNGQNMDYFCSISSSGNPKCWGYNNAGQLGNEVVLPNASPALPFSSTPIPVTVNTNQMVQLSAGSIHVCGLTLAGSIYCWGDNGFGQWGNAGSVGLPVNGTNTTNPQIMVSSGFYHSCSLNSSGNVMCWGDNSYGELGYLSTSTNSPVPVNVSSSSSGQLSGVTQIASGMYFNCAFLSGTNVQCWGDNSKGQLGNGTLGNNNPIPGAVQGLSTSSGNIIQIAAGELSSYFLFADGTIQALGYNGCGELGNNTTAQSLTPVNVLDSSGSSISTAVQMGCGRLEYCCALLSSGSVQCWGYNTSGQLGLGNTANNLNTAQTVSGLSSGVIQLLFSLRSTCALFNSGKVQCWGDNSYGQIGIGTVISSPIPFPNTVPFPSPGPTVLSLP